MLIPQYSPQTAKGLERGATATSQEWGERNKRKRPHVKSRKEMSSQPKMRGVVRVNKES